MKDIYTLAEHFAKSASIAEPLQIKLAAGRKHRKQLEKDLAYVKNVYTRHRSSLDSHERAHSDLSSIIDKERKNVAKSREEIMRCYDVLKNMDLHDIQEVRFMNDDVGYVKGKRLFRLDENQALVPFKRKKQDELDLDMDLGLSDDEELEDEFTADDLLASLVD